MDLGLQGKRAIVFASSKGVGRSIANQMAVEGARGTICARVHEAMNVLQWTDTEIRASGGEVLVLAAAVTN